MAAATKQPLFKIKRLRDDSFESFFINAYTAAPAKIFWRNDGNVYLDTLGTGPLAAQAQKGGTLRVAGNMGQLTVVALALVARTWTGRSRCACGVI